MSPANPGAPVPSSTCPFLTTRSYMSASYLYQHWPISGTGSSRLECRHAARQRARRVSSASAVALSQPLLPADDDRLGAVRDVKLGEHVRNVVPDGLRAEEQP